VNVSSFGRVHTAPQDGRDLELHLGAAALDDHLRHHLRTRIQDGASVASWYALFDRRGDPPQADLDGVEGHLAVRNR